MAPIMEGPMRILYCTVVPLLDDNGGGIVCREHVQRLANLEGCELHVCVLSSGASEAAIRQFVQALGAQFHSIQPRAHRPIARRWLFAREAQALAHRDMDDYFVHLVHDLHPDVVVMDYLFTALFVPSLFSSRYRIVTITLNRESEFFADLRLLGRLDEYSSTSPIAVTRLRHFERDVYERSDAVVVLSPSDLPRVASASVKPVCIQPALANEALRWRPTPDSSLFFVGKIDHYPNYLAIRWLAEKFAPALQLAAPHLRLEIVGATSEQVPASWRHPNITYLGVSTNEVVEQRLLGCKLFVAPIENNFGSKIKVLQCLSRGTPIVGSEGALSGVPFSGDLPKLTLDDAPGAARMVAELASDAERLLHLSACITRLNEQFDRSRIAEWSTLLGEVCKSRPRVRSRPTFFSALRRPRVRGELDVSLPWPRRIEVGVQRPRGVATEGLYDLESLNGNALRWTKPCAIIRVMLNHATLPRFMLLDLYGIAPPGGTGVRVRLNGSEALATRLDGAGLKVSVPLPDLTSADRLEITLEAQAFSPGDDARLLGVPIRSIALCRTDPSRRGGAVSAGALAPATEPSS
jgi:hypothetical protein